MSIPVNLRYSKSHEWLLDTGSGCRIGITDFAREALGDIVYVGLPSVGDAVTIGAPCAEIESVKAVAEIYSPVTGRVTAVNDALLDAPEALGENAYEAWLIEVEATETEELLDADAYAAFLEEQSK